MCIRDRYRTLLLESDILLLLASNDHVWPISILGIPSSAEDSKEITVIKIKISIFIFMDVLFNSIVFISIF